MEDFTRRLLYPAATAKTLKKITQVYRAGERTSEGCRVLLLQRGVGIIRSRWWRVLVYIVSMSRGIAGGAGRDGVRRGRKRQLKDVP